LIRTFLFGPLTTASGGKGLVFDLDFFTVAIFSLLFYYLFFFIVFIRIDY